MNARIWLVCNKVCIISVEQYDLDSGSSCDMNNRLIFMRSLYTVMVSIVTAQGLVQQMLHIT